MKTYIKILLLSGLVLHAGAMEKKGILEIIDNNSIKRAVDEYKDGDNINKIIFRRAATKKNLKDVFSYFGNVKEVRFGCSWVYCGVLELLPERLEGLEIGGCYVNRSRRCIDNDFIKPISYYLWLKKLDVSSSDIDDKALPFIPKSVEILDLRFTKITDKAVCYLGENFSGLIKLSLSGCEITDKSLVHLKSLKNLKVLAIAKCKELTPKGLMVFFESYSRINPNLEKLVIFDNKVTDDVLKKVSCFKGLKYLDVSYLRDITNEGLKYFCNHKKLNKIVVWESKNIYINLLDCTIIDDEDGPVISFLKKKQAQ